MYQDSLYSGFSRAAELRAKAGETNRLEMITARSQSLEIKNQLQQMKADIGILNRQLATLLNVDTPLIPVDTVLIRADYVPFADSTALLANPLLGQINQQVEIGRMEKRLEQSRALPDFSVGYFSQTMQGTTEVNGLPRIFGPGDRFNGIQAGIAIPLWFTSYSAKIKAARIKEKAAEASAGQFSRSLDGKYRSLLDEYEKFRSSVEYYEKQALPEAEMIIDQSIRSYKAGALDYLEYVLSLSRAFSIRQNYLDALNSLNQTVINIEYITGKLF